MARVNMEKKATNIQMFNSFKLEPSDNQQHLHNRTLYVGLSIHNKLKNKTNERSL